MNDTLSTDRLSRYKVWASIYRTCHVVYHVTSESYHVTNESSQYCNLIGLYCQTLVTVCRSIRQGVHTKSILVSKVTRISCVDKPWHNYQYHTIQGLFLAYFSNPDIRYRMCVLPDHPKIIDQTAQKNFLNKLNLNQDKKLHRFKERDEILASLPNWLSMRECWYKLGGNTNWVSQVYFKI